MRYVYPFASVVGVSAFQVAIQATIAAMGKDWGPGWWEASNGRWYPPPRPGSQPPPQAAPPPQAYPAPPAQPVPGWSPTPPGPKRGHKGLIVAGSIIGVLMLLIIIGAIAGGPKKSTSAVSTDTTVTPSPSPAPTGATTVPTRAPAATSPPPPTTVAGPKVVFQQSGSGQASTPSFGVKDEWQLAWTYDCSKFFGGTGNFIVSISQPPGKVGIDVASNDTGVNQLGAGGSGVEHYHYGGTIFLQVNSECSWSIKVTS